MIRREEIEESSERLGLSLDVIEKDYILGWLIAGINHDSNFRDNWIFKGGTCLKKCFFKDYRFSEDLDFTILDQAQINSAFLKNKFTNIANWIYEQTGIELPFNLMEFKERINPRGKLVITGKISYHGPIRRQGSLPRVKLDLNANEVLVSKSIESSVYHPYSDLDGNLFKINSYSYDEIFAEKVRALGERCLPRDLYDVVYIYRQDSMKLDQNKVIEILSSKCKFKGIEVPSKESVYSEERLEHLKSSWERMLRHQLRDAPLIEEYLAEINKVFDWLSINKANN